jgi:AcrR family transcriptional regulator
MATRASTREKLLTAAVDVAFIEGDVTAGVDRILERAGVSPATLYRAYDSKEELFAAALERRLAEWLGAWDDAIAHASSDRARLLAIFDALDAQDKRHQSARWCAFLAAAATFKEPSPSLADAVAVESAVMRKRLTELARPVVAAHASAVADELMLVFSGWLAMRLRPGPPTSLATAKRIASQVIDAAEKRGHDSEAG